MIRWSDCRNILIAEAVLSVAAAFIFAPAFLTGLLAVAFTLYFFRDPERITPDDIGAIISSADGKVMSVELVDDPFVGAATKVAVFMSPFDVHINRSPFEGVIRSVKHTPGKKIAAYLEGSPEGREHVRIELAGVINIALIQYAGVFARRIVPFVKECDEVRVGQRIGMIKFGSRVDVILPKNVEVKVKKGERVRAGETVIGVLSG